MIQAATGRCCPPEGVHQRFFAPDSAAGSDRADDSTHLLSKIEAAATVFLFHCTNIVYITNVNLLVFVQGSLAAPAGHAISCMEYLVSGSYSVRLQAADGSYSYATGSSSTPAVLSDDCRSGLAHESVGVDVLVEYGDSYAWREHGISITPHHSAGMRLFCVLQNQALQDAVRGREISGTSLQPMCFYN